ncbi:MAG: hypothetical protein DWQ47_16870 [Acidobacteria bacterium]|mgnify:CR=1 FL=1|nr:MAG: hypothetical protein DWQ32_04270 [Acidobacteriota bacterium]REK02284.1 MAG: hypothetical protein DWQ38_07880 [Acidobacteriota bacterium]REK13913.1 MAG: hypothetical protein DWQ43_09960 [Acidobacteriota bacterium]REK41907.1 MAG: hypothetical protein DWQ47_16870 [Acidobacteriota bacterium]
MTKRNARSGLYIRLSIIAGAAVLAVATVAFSGIPYGNDLTQHYQFAATVNEALANGEFYPSLSPAANSGVGDYGLRFYPPLAYYALAIAFKATGGWYAASILVFFLAYFAGGIGVYLWAREELTGIAPTLAAVLFILAPYHLNQIYNNFLFAEFAASAVIPFCFLFVHRTAARPSFSAAAGLGLSYGLLVLTHLPSLIFCSLAFAVYGVVVLYRSRNWIRSGLALAGGVIAGISATSFYWIKLVTELEWIRHARQEYFSDIYSYTNNFLLNPSTFTSIAEDVQAIWLGDLMLLATLLIAVPSSILLFRQRREAGTLVVASFVTMIFAAFFSSVLSTPLWDYVAFLQKIQFPWRWMGVVSVTAAVFAAYGIARAGELMKEKEAGVVLPLVLTAGVLIYALISVFVTKQSVFIPAAEFSNEKVEAMHTAPSRDCWWTVWAEEGFYKETGSEVTLKNRSFRVRRWDTLEKQIGVWPGPETEAVFSILYYPHWRAYADEERISVENTDSGLIRVTVPQDAKSITLRFREPNEVRTAAIVSASAFSLIAFVLVISLARRTFRKEDEGTEGRPQISN